MANETSRIQLTLPDHEADDVAVEAVHGREALGETYAFTAHVISQKSLDLDSMMGKAAKLVITVLDEEAVVHGVVTLAEMGDRTQSGHVAYRFVIEPELAMLRLCAQNQVYGTDKDVTVIDIIEGEMNDANASGSSTGSSRPNRNIQYSMLADTGSYPTLEFVLQYEENDLNFLMRLCERFGIYVAFDQSGDKEKVLFCDRNQNLSRLSDPLLYRSSKTASLVELSIYSFQGIYTVQSGTIEMREFNDETPSVDLSVSKSSDNFDSNGVRVDYHENYKTTSEGDFLAQRRVELQETNRLKFRGRSNIPQLRPGQIFKIDGYHNSDLDDKEYIVIEVEHHIVEQAPEGYTALDESEVGAYTNTFICIPYETTFRPELRTAKPVIRGVLIGFVDAEGDGQRAELDDQGRYRIRITSEESGLDNGKASAYVRKMEMYGGGDSYGAHATLRKGTEILLSFIDGDPDRPVIIGALSNAEQTNPITSSNQNTAFRMRTANTVFEISDGAV